MRGIAALPENGFVSGKQHMPLTYSICYAVYFIPA